MNFDLLAGLEVPTPEQIAQARANAGQTQAQAAAMVGLSAAVRWSEHERSGASSRRIDLARWALYLLATGQHPAFLVVRNVQA